MKRFMLALAMILLIATLLFAACEKAPDNSDASIPEGESDSDSSIENKPAESSYTESSNDSFVSNDESNTDDEGDESQPDDSFEIIGADKISVLYCSYSEKPYFAMVGQCEEGATVTAECNGETVSSESYKGWFSLRLRCNKSSVKVKLSQTVGGELVSCISYTAKPITPSADMWPVVTGKNFQFFFQKMLPDFRGKTVDSASTYTALTSKVESRLTQLRSYNPNAEIVYMVVPSSMTIYPELVPSTYKPAKGETRLDKTMDALSAGGATVIDLKEILTQHKNDEMPVYYKLDSHWSDYGAYVAYDALFQHISKKFPAATPRTADEFDWNPDYYDSGDMTYYLQMSQQKVKEYAYYRTFDFSAPADILSVKRYRSSTMLCYSDAVTEERTFYTNRSELPTVTVLRDSYSTQIYDLIPERSNITYYHAMWDTTWNAYKLQQEAPDYVIYIVAEWNLDSIVKG